MPSQDASRAQALSGGAYAHVLWRSYGPRPLECPRSFL